MIRRTNIKMGLVCVTALAVLSAFSQAPTGKASDKAFKKGEPGMFVRDIRNMRGCVLFVDAQKRIDASEGLDRAIAALEAEFCYDIRRTKTDEDVSPVNVSALRTKLKATFAVFIVDSASFPMLTSFPDERIAVLNVAPLADKGVDARKLARRIRFGAIRAFAFAFGAGFSQYQALLMSPVDSLVELDVLPGNTFLPFDSAVVIRKVAASRGLTPYRTELYETACEEGWASPPTNDVQKAVWDKVHALPTEPIKITPETKKTTE